MENNDSQVRRLGRVWWQNELYAASFEENSVNLFDSSAFFSSEYHYIHSVDYGEVAWLAPVNPKAVIAVGRNYQDHAQELGNDVPQKPLFFQKPIGTIIAHRQAIERPTWAGRIDYEGELVVVIGKTARNLPSLQAAEDVIFGYTIGNDVTARELQKIDGQWTRAKGFDTFAPLGPWITVEKDWKNRRLVTRVNGEVRQDGSTNDLIFPIPFLIQEVSRFLTLVPGDVIFTGTPSGVGPIYDGDLVEISIDGIGTLSNSVIIRE